MKVVKAHVGGRDVERQNMLRFDVDGRSVSKWVMYTTTRPPFWMRFRTPNNRYFPDSPLRFAAHSL